MSMKQLFCVLNHNGHKVSKTECDNKMDAKKLRDEMNKHSKKGRLYTVGLTVEHRRFRK